MIRPPTIVTLTSDFGWRDFHLALIKGKILSQVPGTQLIDLSHEVENYNIVQGAFLFKHAWQAFPSGTIHVVSINDFSPESPGFLVFAKDGHFFIGPDNGFFSLVFDEQPPQLYQINLEQVDSNFPLANIFGHAVGHLAQDFPPGGLGSSVEKWIERITFQPVIGPNYIRGTVVYVDNFDNVIINIQERLFDEIGHGRTFKLFFKRHQPITQRSAVFHEVPVGEPLCRFNAAGLLEIAINMGRAAQLFGLKVEDTVQVDFE